MSSNFNGANHAGAQSQGGGTGRSNALTTGPQSSGQNTQQNPSTQIITEKVKQPGGEVSHRQYIKGKFLGKGGFAKCYEFVQCETKAVTAAKVILKASLQRSRAKQKLMSEIKIHRSIKHANVAQFMHFFEDSECVYILLELCHNQSMNELIKRRKRLHELEVKCYTLQIINALKYLHSHRIIHRDLKLGNIFLNDKMAVKLGDFGLATKLDFEGEKKRTICGTPNYIAPEVLEGRSGHSYEVDIWSLGVIIYTLIIGKPPFETTDVKATYRRIKLNQFSFPDHVPISDEARDLISRILTSDPTARPNLEQIMVHPFMTNCQIPKLLPQSLLACVPSSQYVRQFMPQSGSNLGGGYNTQNPVPRGIDPAAAQNDPLGRIQRKNSGQRPATSNQAPVFTDRAPATQHNFARGSSNTDAHSNKMPQINEQRAVGNVVPQMSLRSNSSKDHQSLGSNRQPVRAQQQMTKPATAVNTGSIDQTTQVWVTKWVDYSSKYGLGYLLSDLSGGVFFNDSTKVVAESSGTQFYYYERKTIAANEKQDVMSQYSFSQFPQELKKKITLLKHFQSYLEQNLDPAEKEKLLQRNVANGSNKLGCPPGSVYVKKWMRTKHAIMFRLSNKIVQVNFQDHTEILLNSESRFVTYVNKKGERSTMPLNQALDSNNAEMTKRLKYTKDILTHMLNNNAQPNAQGRSSNPSIGSDPTAGPTGMSSNSSRRGAPIPGLNLAGTPNSNGESMNGFGLGGPSLGSNGIQTMSSIGQSNRKK